MTTQTKIQQADKGVAYTAAFADAISAGKSPRKALEAGLAAMEEIAELERGLTEYGIACRVYATKRSFPPKPHPMFDLMRRRFNAGRTLTFIEDGRVERLAKGSVA